MCPQIPADKCDLLEDLVQKLQKREVRLNRQEFLHKVRDIAGEDAPALRHALKQLAVDRSPSAPPGESPQLGNGFHLPSTELSSADLAAPGEAGASSAMAQRWSQEATRYLASPRPRISSRISMPRSADASASQASSTRPTRAPVQSTKEREQHGSSGLRSS